MLGKPLIAKVPMAALAAFGTMLLPAAVMAAVPIATGEQVTNTLNCLAGQAGNGVTGQVEQLFTFNIAGGAVNVIRNTVVYYELICFAVVVAMLVIRLTSNAAKEGIDGLILNAFHTGLGPGIVFAAGLFLVGAIGGGAGNLVIPNMLASAATFGTDVGNNYSQASGAGTAALAAARAMNIPGAIATGNIGGIMGTGVCTAQAVVFGAPPVATGNGIVDKAIALGILGVKAVETLAEGPAGIINVVLMVALKSLLALYLLWVIARVGFECFILFLAKALMLPLGLAFFAVGQLPFLAFFKDAYIRLVASTFTRITVLAMLLPLFIGVMVAACVIATVTSLLPIGEYIGLFVEIIAVAFLDFFIKHYKEYADGFTHGSSGPSGDSLARAFHSAGNATYGAITNAIRTGIQSAGAGMVASTVANVGGQMADAMAAEGGTIRPPSPPPPPPPPPAPAPPTPSAAAVTLGSDATYEPPPLALTR